MTSISSLFTPGVSANVAFHSAAGADLVELSSTAREGRKEGWGYVFFELEEDAAIFRDSRISRATASVSVIGVKTSGLEELGRAARVGAFTCRYSLRAPEALLPEPQRRLDGARWEVKLRSQVPGQADDHAPISVGRPADYAMLSQRPRAVGRRGIGVF